MGGSWINIRFGSYHIIIGRDGISGGFNWFHQKGGYARKQPDWRWFKIHEFFGRVRP